MSRYTPLVRAEVDEWRRRLLPGWQIKLRDELPDDYDANDLPAALVSWDDHLFYCNLWLSDGVLHGDRDYRQTTIIHELMHPMFRALRAAFMPGEGDPDRDLWEHYEEIIVERVALAVADPHYTRTILET